jgi:hypothetical protein
MSLQKYNIRTLKREGTSTEGWRVYVYLRVQAVGRLGVLTPLPVLERMQEHCLSVRRMGDVVLQHIPS